MTKRLSCILSLLFVSTAAFGYGIKETKVAEPFTFAWSPVSTPLNFWSQTINGTTAQAQCTAANDTGTTGAFVFDARRTTGAVITSRPTFQWTNFGASQGEVSAAGAWVVGPTTGSTQVSHKVEGYSNLLTLGNGTLNLNNRQGSAPSIVFGISGSKTGSIYSSAGYPFAVNDATTNDLGYVSSAGAWTLGPVGFTGTHSINGSLSLGPVVPSFNSSSYGYVGNKYNSVAQKIIDTTGNNFFLSSGTYFDGSANRRSVANQTGSIITLRSDSSTAGNAFVFSTDPSISHAADSTNSFTTIGTASILGYWALGNSASGSGGVVYAPGGGGGYFDVAATSALNTTSSEMGIRVTVSGLGVAASLQAIENSTITTPVGVLATRATDGTSYYLWNVAGKWTTGGTFGNIGTATGTVVGDQTSDSRIKENIVDLPYGLAEVLQLRPTRYNRISAPGKIEIGLLADEVQQVIPEVVYNTGETVNGHQNILAMTYQNLVPVLINATQDLKAEKDAELAEIRATVEDLKEEIRLLKLKHVTEATP